MRLGRQELVFKRLAVAAVILVAGWTALIAYALHPALPSNAVKLPYETKLGTREWLPEGWAFFTRNPREEHTLIFRKDDHAQWRQADLGPNGGASNYFGIGRQSRAQLIELGALTFSIPHSKYSDCQKAPIACLDGSSNTMKLINPSPRPTLCGPLGVVLQEQLPWAWAKSAGQISMPSKILRIDVTC